MATDDEVITPAARRVRIPDHLNWWKPEYADWELPDINITHLVTRFMGNFDVAAWNRSIEMLLDKHLILSARVEVDGDVAEFILDGRSSEQFAIINLPASEGKNSHATLRELTAALVWQPFDRRGGRPFRAFMIKVSDHECVLGVVVHHGIADGWSMAIIGRELLAGYAATITGRQNQLPLPEVQYLEYIEWMQNWLSGPDARLQQQFWAQQMVNVQSMGLPMESDIDLDAMAEWAKESFTIEPALVQTMCKRAGQTRTTPFLLTLTAKIAALAAMIESCDIVVSIVAEQRTRSRLRNTIGPLVNYLPIRATVSWSESFDQLATQVRAVYVKACANQTYPYALIKPSEVALPSFRFRRIVGEHAPSELPSRGFQFFELPPPPPTRTPVRGMGHELFILHADDHMSCRIRYLSTIHRRETVTRFAQLFCRALTLGAHESTKPLSSMREPTRD